MSAVGAAVYSICADFGRCGFQSSGRNYHAEKLAAEAERKRIYYIALYADMERARAAQVPMVIGADLGYRVPNNYTEAA